MCVLCCLIRIYILIYEKTSWEIRDHQKQILYFLRTLNNKEVNYNVDELNLKKSILLVKVS